MMKLIVIIICLYILPVSNCLAQKNITSPNNVVNNRYHNEFPEEAIYLHINSSFLLVGESILFKAYCLNTIDNTLSQLSTIAYVELIDANASPVLQAKILLKEGSGSGDFFLPSTLSSGNYTLIAYTNWMKNYPIKNIFKIQVTVINPFRKPISLQQKMKPHLQVEFFPEGGKLVSGVNNTIAFSANDEKGNGVNFTGKIIDETGNTVLEFSPAHKGKGRFSLIPAPGKVYKAIIIDSLQNIYFQPLPLAIGDGIAMQVVEKENTFQIDLVSRGIGKNAKAKILAHHENNLYVEMEVQFSDEQARCEIKKTLLPFGISQLSVYTTDNQVVCERSIFNKPIDEPILDLLIERRNYKTRDKVRMTFVMNDTLGAHLSISVRKIEKKIDKPFYISSYLFLEDGNTEMNFTKKDNWIDDEMLTRKNTSDTSENLLDNKASSLKYLPEVRGNLITGTVNRKDSSAAAEEKVYLSVPSKAYLFFVSITDSTGRFYFNTNKIKLNTEVILQVAPSTCAECQIKLDDISLDDYTSFIPNVLEIDSSFRKLIEQRSILAQIENAYYSQKQDSILFKPQTIPFYGRPDKSYRLDDYVRFPTMEDVFIEYILEVILKKKGNDFEIKAMDFRKRVAFTEDPLILIDGIPIFDINQVMNYNPLLLYKIEIVGRRYFYGPLETQGIISLTTYEGTGKNIPAPQKEKYLGILPEKRYFSPTYSSTSSSLDKTPDYRTQLYWNPDIVLSSNRFPIEFYTSDVAGDFEIVVEGIRADGQPIHYRETIHIDGL